MKKFFIASMDTEHFSFQALGLTEKEALKALGRGFKRHQKECKGHWYEGCPPLEYYGAHCDAIEAGECLRDGEPI